MVEFLDIMKLTRSGTGADREGVASMSCHAQARVFCHINRRRAPYALVGILHHVTKRTPTDRIVQRVQQELKGMRHVGALLVIVADDSICLRGALETGSEDIVIDLAANWFMHAERRDDAVVIR